LKILVISLISSLIGAAVLSLLSRVWPFKKVIYLALDTLIAGVITLGAFLKLGQYLKLTELQALKEVIVKKFMEQNLTNIRNFVIIAHIDHGKSTLADRFLELTETISKSKLEPQFLDRMNLEKKHGITIKMHPVRMNYRLDNNLYTLNLIDTPGHVDFSYEVSRALAAVEGAILLVDGTQGIQAQTLSNLANSQEQGLKIIGAINKIDLDIPNLEAVRQDVANLLQVPSAEVSLVSAKTGQGVAELLKRVVQEIPPPSLDKEAPFKALIFDSQYNYYRGGSGLCQSTKVVKLKKVINFSFWLVSQKAKQ